MRGEMAAACLVYVHAEFMARAAACPSVCDLPPGKSGAGSARRGASDQATHTIGTTARLRYHLAQFGGLIVPAAQALIREARPPSDGAPGNRHSTLVSIVTRCAQARWSDQDIRDLVLPLASEAWEAADLSERLDSILRWTRERESTKLGAERPLSDRAKHVAAALRGKAGAQ